MKLTVGLGSVDEYIRFSEAGADEFFCGYVPYSWTQKYDTMMPLNRREVLCSNVQLGAFSELEILSSMIRDYQRPVHLTFNSLFYLPEQYPEITKIMKACMCLGFQSYIIADPALILYLREHNIDCEIHLSGETGEVNSQMVDFFQQFSLKRVIFHRKNSFDDMKAVIDAEKSHGGLRAETDFEAFILNEMCQFTGWSLLITPVIPWYPNIFVHPHLSLPCRFPRQIHLNCLMDISAVPPAVDSVLFTAFGKSALLT